MSAIKHTPGPWYRTGSTSIMSANGCDEVARVTPPRFGPEPAARAEADHRLIAAAPEMLAELHRAADALNAAYIETGYLPAARVRDGVMALIRKVEGVR